MRIAIISTASSDSLGGLSSYIRLLEMNLRKRNIEVATAARFVSPDPPSFIDYAAVERPDAVSLKPVPTKAIRPNPAYGKTLKELDHLVNRPVLRDAAKRIYVSAFQAALSDSIPVEVDHLHYVGTGQELLGFAVLAESNRRGIGMTAFPAVHPFEWGDGPLDIDLYSRVDATFCLSNLENSHLASKGVPIEKLVTTGLGPGTEPSGNAAQFCDRHNLDNRRLVLFIGRKDRGKGYHALCAAMPAVYAAIPDVCLVAIGPSREPPYPSVPELAFLDLGMASDAEKADALAACDLFCMPSEGESFGIVYVEAWANRKPVIGGMAPAVRELITDDVNGVCVSQDPGEIARSLIRLLDDEALRRRMGDQGYKLQQDKYTWQSVTDTHIEVFDRAIQRRRH